MIAAAIQPDAIQNAPGLVEATAIEFDNEQAMKGLRHYVLMGLRLMDVKARLPHGKYIPWLEKYLPDISKRHLHRAKSIAEGLCEMTGLKSDARVTFDAFETTLPKEFEAIVSGATGYRALLSDIQEFRQDTDEQTAKATCEALFSADPELRDEWEPRALSGELSWTLVLRGIKGQEATKDKRRSDPDYQILIPRSLTTLHNGFANWDRLPPAAQDTTIIELKKLVSDLPATVRAAIGLGK